ncbi:MAG: cellulase family glycosylhydrolase [Kiritimatiellae bacterium]|nr:cellulase family glycosylhydrolase [Kiritimatiellia bacterium]
MKKRTMVVSAAVLLSAVVHGADAVVQAKDPLPGLSVVNRTLTLKGQQYCGMGVNYFSLFYRSLKKRDDLSYVEGLEALAEAGIPFVRFMACGFWPVDWELYLNDKEGYFSQLDAVVSCAERNQIGLIPSLFWNMATVPDIVGEPMDQLGDPGSKTIAFIRQYTSEIVQRYKDSPAIWGWEFGNEYNLHVDLPNASSHRPPIWRNLKTASTRSERDEVSAEMMLTAYGEFATTVHQYDKHRVLITGNSIPRPSAWHNSKEKSWKVDSREEFAAVLQRDNPDPFSMLCVHVYPRENNQYSGGFGNLADLVAGLQAISVKAEKPLFIGEFGATRELGASQERKLFSEIVAALETNRVALSALWVFDHAGQNQDWNITFDNQRAYMLKEISEANQRMKFQPK